MQHVITGTFSACPSANYVDSLSIHYNILTVLLNYHLASMNCSEQRARRVGRSRRRGSRYQRSSGNFLPGLVRRKTSLGPADVQYSQLPPRSPHSAQKFFAMSSPQTGEGKVALRDFNSACIHASELLSIF